MGNWGWALTQISRFNSQTCDSILFDSISIHWGLSYQVRCQTEDDK